LIAAVLVAAAVALIVANGGSTHGGDPYQVRAIFDNAAFAVPGEDVRIAGAPVGTISSLDVTATSPRKAAITLTISDSQFTPFHADATCAIRLQSLIGEKYIDCNPGTTAAPELSKITRGAGAGTYLLPVTQTSSPVEVDIVQDISQQPIRQRLAIIIDELGTGLAARGSDLNAVIHRANPALGYTDKVFQILAAQNRQLAQLAADSDAVLGPLARVKRQLADFVVQANTTSVASAARSADIARSIQLLPQFLTQLRPLMADLGSLADQGTPVMSSLSQSAAGLNRQFAALTPFAAASRSALIELGKSAAQSQAPLVASLPLAQRLEAVGANAAPAAAQLDSLTASLDRSGAIEQLMGVLFSGTEASNGFDALGHFVRSQVLVGSCTAYAQTPVPGCSANFTPGSGGARDVSARVASEAVRRTAGHIQTPSLIGLLHYLLGSGR
jgi:ABC-type transporter Mla subunit MlaD